MAHTVKQGECLISIAQDYGLSDWRSIYDAPENEAFRELRKNPNMICPGDVVHIPGIKASANKLKLNKKNTFVVKKSKGYFSICLTDSQFNPLADIPYTLKIFKSESDIDKEPLSVFENEKTDADGYVEQKLPTGAKFAYLEYAPYPSRPSLILKKRLHISELDDPRTETGMRSRLNHFGFFSGEGQLKDNDEKELFASQLEAFKKKYDLSDDDSVVEFFDNPTAIS
ncbi:LysM peptidoglycan-binding domain-containing protein [Bermanella sp. R86510]|uniref:LysM peptidoglycan-binding domain-containing protein n=1 Tax=unclassified Bermanella TaxID=2627862 RepID=UPI0037CC1629